MSADAPTPPDQIDGAPHPRETLVLQGQHNAESVFLEAFNSGRLHHGWLLTGPKGVGKATLAWRIARFLLATPPAEDGGLFGDAPPQPETLDIPVDHPVSRRILAGADPGLHHITRTVSETTGRMSTMITAGNVRGLNQFLHLSAADGGRRVVILDCADEMNVQAANALLKMLEEPPARTTLLLIAHQPAGLLPTIRSRCRVLKLTSLPPEDMAAALEQAGIDPGENSAALTELAEGSVGEAVRLINLDGLSLYAEIVAIAASLPTLDRPRALKLADQVAGRGNADRLDLLISLVDLFLSRLARSGATRTIPTQAAPKEAETFARLAPTPHKARDWADCAQEIGARARHGRAVNLDPAALVLDTVFRIQKTAST